MGYENSAACEIMATNCCACGKPLVDAKSVETGIGPVCRKKYGYDAGVSEKAREMANQVVYALACAISEGTVTLSTLESVEQLRVLGFPLIADIFVSNGVSVSIDVRDHEGEERYFVRAPYDPAFNQSCWINGRVGVKDVVAMTVSKRKVFHWTFPKTEASRKRIWGALVKHHAGRLAVANGVPFQIAPLKTAAQKAQEAA